MILNTLMADPFMTVFEQCYFIYICVIYSSSTHIGQVILDLQKSLMITALIHMKQPGTLLSANITEPVTPKLSLDVSENVKFIETCEMWPIRIFLKFEISCDILGQLSYLLKKCIQNKFA